MSGLRISNSISVHAASQSRLNGASRICLASGISGAMAEQRLITLNELHDALKLSLAEAYTAERDERFWGRALIAAKFTKVTCNVILSVMAEWVPNEAAASMIKDASDGVQAYVEGDAYGVARVVGERIAKKHGEIAEISTKEIFRRADFIKDGLSGKLDARRTTKYLADETLFIAKMTLKELKKPIGAQVVETTRALNSYAFDLYDLLEQAQSNEKISRGSSAGVKTIISQMQRIEAKIRELKDQLESCDVPQMLTLLGPKT